MADATVSKDKALDFTGTDFGMDVECSLGGAIVNKDGQGNTLTFTNVDGTTRIYDSNAFTDKANRVALGCALRFGFDQYIETAGPKFRLGFRPAGLSVRSGKFRVNPGENNEIYDPNNIIEGVSEQDLHTVTAAEIFYSLAFEAGVEIHHSKIFAGIAATLDVGGMVLFNPKTNGFYMTGAYSPHNRSVNQDKDPAVAKVSIGPKIGPFGVRFVFDLPLDQGINLGKKPFEANGETHNVMGLSGPDSIPYGLTRQGTSLEVFLDAAEGIRWLAKVTENPRKLAKIHRLEDAVETLREVASQLEDELNDLEGELVAFEGQTDPAPSQEQIEKYSADITAKRQTIRAKYREIEAAQRAVDVASAEAGDGDRD